MLSFMTGHWEILVVAGVIVLVFFGRRIPEIMRSLGKGVTQFKKGLKEGKEDEGEDGRPAGTKSLPAPKDDSQGVAAGDVEKEEAGLDRPNDDPRERPSG